jgi:UDP-N-acetylglucosamine 2-epimerase (non-hydrolysing)
MTITIVAGARPNFIKIKPIIDALIQEGFKDIQLVHTGQHYDENMSGKFFKELNIPEPDVNLGIGAGSHAFQTANIMIKFENYLIKSPTDLLIVVGDVNSTLACSLVASKMGVKIAHVEAGLRSGNWAMPEEVNRVLTDHMSDYLFTTSEYANKNLQKEGFVKDKVFFVGNVMIDTLLKNKKKSDSSNILNNLDIVGQDFILVTLHRPSNVDSLDDLKKYISFFGKLSNSIKVIFSIHPRTKNKLKNTELWEELIIKNNILLIDALGYIDFIKVLSSSKIVITDSGGIQEEATVLGTPCITLRQETERPETVNVGTNKIVGNDIALAEKLVEDFLSNPVQFSVPKLWDGKASKRIAKILSKIYL